MDGTTGALPELNAPMESVNSVHEALNEHSALLGGVGEESSQTISILIIPYIRSAF